MRSIAFLILFALGCATVRGGGAAPEAELAVVPQHERARAASLDAHGPTETRGVTSIRALGTVPLGGDFPALEGRVLRAREIVVAPGGVVGVHEHDRRPGVAYMLEGELVEHRAGASGPVVKRAGDTAFERSGVIHWWANESDAPARAIVVDVFPEEDAH